MNEPISLFDVMPQTLPNPAELLAEQVFSVSGAVELINGILEPLTLMIEGEVTGFKVNQGKWVFFDIKDESAVLNCFMTLYQLPFMLEDGMKIKLQGTPKIRGASGRFSLTVKSLELLGEGALLKAFEDLKKKLEAEGLFDQKWKKELPFFPKRIGLITSKSGDALQDMLRIMKNRAGGLELVLAPVSVQGQSAVSEICAAIQLFNSRVPVDVLIVARGGGSLEDLQAFNTEPVVRAIFASKILVVTGVGHEPDVTLVDLVSDKRAATPTNAAEIVVPDFDALAADLDHHIARLTSGLKQLVISKEAQLDKLVHRLHQGLKEPLKQVDNLRERLIYQLKQRERMFWSRKSEILSVQQLLISMRQRYLLQYHQKLQNMEQHLSILDPKRVLERGYSITTTSDGAIVRSVKQVSKNDSLDVQLSDGIITTKVESLRLK